MASGLTTVRPAHLLLLFESTDAGAKVDLAADIDHSSSVDFSQAKRHRSWRPGSPSGGTMSCYSERWALRIAMTCLVAILCAAPWLKPNLVWCGWLGIAGALWLATNLTGRGALCCTAGWTFVAIAVAFYWSPEVLAYTMDSGYPLGVAVFVPLALWDVCRATLPIWLAGRVARNPAEAWLPAGMAAVILEFFVPTIFPWRWGYSQVAWPWTIQAVDIFGAEWSTFMVFAYAGAILSLGRLCADSWPRRCRATEVRGMLKSVVLNPALIKSPAIWLCLVSLMYSGASRSYWSQRISAATRMRVALVQVDPSFKGSVADAQRWTLTVSKQVDLVCWPESIAGTYEVGLDSLSEPRHVFDRSREPNRGLRPWQNPDCELLFGGKTYSGDRDLPDRLYQSAFLVDKQEQIVGRYHKRQLMPFGEFVPGHNWVPGIDSLFNLTDFVEAGEEATVLHAATGAKLGVMLCYEDMTSEAARSLTQRSANVLVSLANGSAFTNPLTLMQHRILSQLRAVECRRYFLRCAATGETCVISPLGDLEAQLPVQTQGVLTADVALLDGQSVSCRIGSIFPVLCCLMLCIYFKLSRAGH
jgi:apolipoprotein N-acyltransferase